MVDEHKDKCGTKWFCGHYMSSIGLSSTITCVMVVGEYYNKCNIGLLVPKYVLYNDLFNNHTNHITCVTVIGEQDNNMRNCKTMVGYSTIIRIQLCGCSTTSSHMYRWLVITRTSGNWLVSIIIWPYFKCYPAP